MTFAYSAEIKVAPKRVPVAQTVAGVVYDGSNLGGKHLLSVRMMHVY